MEFINWAAQNGFRLVKLLPINETGGDHSPYNALSSRALDPTTIRTSPEALPDLRLEEYEAVLRTVPSEVLEGDVVDYDVVKPLKRALLEAAFARFARNQLSRKTARAEEFLRFTEEQREWLEDYSLFRVLLETHEGQSWDEWPEEHRSPEKARHWLANLKTRAAHFIEKRRRYFTYVQWIAFSQWRKVKAHAEQLRRRLDGRHSLWHLVSKRRCLGASGTLPDRLVRRHSAGSDFQA